MLEFFNFRRGHETKETSLQINIENYLEGIKERPELKSSKNSLMLSDLSRVNLTEFVGELKTKKAGDKKVVVVVRCWGKSEEDVQNLLKKLEEMKKDLPELGAVVISVNVEGDQKVKDSKPGFSGTLENVDSLLSKLDKNSLKIIPMGVSGYTWTSGLNGPAALLNNICKGEGVSTEDVMIFNQSFGVEFSSDEVQKIHESIKSGKPIISERADLKDQFMDNDSKKKLVDNIIEKLRKNDVVEVADIFPILARNTGMVFSLSDIAEIGGFNPITNSMGGMEDHEFEARHIVYNLRRYNELKDTSPEESGKCARKVIEILKVLKKQDFVLYNDVDWQPKQGESDEAAMNRRKSKLSTEIGADTKITNELLAKTFDVDDTSKAAILSPENRDFYFVR